MRIDPSNIDFENIEDVTDIKPAPNVAVRRSEHHFSGLGQEGKRLLLELLDVTSEDEPFADRVFGRLGVGYRKAEWNEYELYWVEGGGDALLGALERWNQAQNL